MIFDNFQVQFTLVISIWSDELCQMELYVPCLNYLHQEWLTDTTWPWIPMTMFYTFLMPNPIGLFDYWTWSILLTLILITKLLLEVESGVCQVSNYYIGFIFFKNSDQKLSLFVNIAYCDTIEVHLLYINQSFCKTRKWKCILCHNFLTIKI